MTKHLPNWEYTDAVQALLELAFDDTGGSKGAALVLLSTYNPSRWQINVGALTPLDHHYFSAALAVLDGRVAHMREPHKMIQNGDEVFHKLWKEWEHLPEHIGSPK